MDSFAKTHDAFWKTLVGIEPNQVLRYTGCVFDVLQGVFKVRFINETYLVDPVRKTITALDPVCEEPGFEIKTIIITYLTLGRNTALSGEWVTEKAIPSGDFFFRGPHALPGGKIFDCFGNDISALEKRCRTLGGNVIEGFGDLAVEFLLLPKFPLRLIYWKSDDEFPARVSFLMDKSAGGYLLLDGILGIVNILTKRIIAV